MTYRLRDEDKLAIMLREIQLWSIFFIFDGEINFVWYIKVLIIMLVKTDILDTIPYKYQ